VAHIAEKRRNERVRKVCPVTLYMPGDGSAPAHRIVTANISPGGMLLVSRMDRFPPAGCAVRVRPEAHEAQPLPARVVYTRYSARAEMRFAGVKFETEVNDTDLRWFDLTHPDDELGVALERLAEIEIAPPAPAPAQAPRPEPRPAPDALPARSPLKPVGPALPPEESVGFEPLRESVLAALATFAGEWGEAYIRDTIVRRHALARAKGVEGMRELKRAWRAAEAELPGLLDRTFTLPEPHAANAPELTENPWYDEEQDQSGRPILESLRTALGVVGRILIEHGYEDPAQSPEWTTAPATSARVRYAGPLQISDALRSELRRAAHAHTETLARDRRAQHETRARQREELIRWWESA